jgi:hypothetical protein
MKRILSASVIIAMMIFTACSKDNDKPDNENPSGDCLVKTASTTGSGIQPYRTEYEYNSAEQLTKTKYYPNNVLESYDTYQYDSKGNATVWEQFNSSNNTIGKRVAKFDNEGRVSGYTEYLYDAFNIDTVYYAFVYQNDKIIGYDYFTDNIADTTNRTVRYYENGNLVKMDVYSGLSNTIIQTNTYTYSADQNKQYDAEKGLMIYSRTLPNKNMPASMTSNNGQFNINASYTYTKDASGRITEKTETTKINNNSVITKTAYTFTCN